ncbi:kinesin motor domain containing protein [Nitzschia inconspicua]|uniref:Kinesin motor domain containing protein n=1 Tax=Nitzschia inconspicua TaxID=303405 RepID=A0A9K3PRG0_9STRA|nr:kinesin motor domain containing protein [Nitzschia inconspicua]
MSATSLAEVEFAGDENHQPTGSTSELTSFQEEGDAPENSQDRNSVQIFPPGLPLGVDDGTCVQVAVRVRPMLPHEQQEAATNCVNVFSSEVGAVSNVIQLGGESGPKFTFDQVFDSNTLQSHVYEDRVAPLVVNCLEGYNATVLAYGQTGSGKTHTIMGPSTTLATAMLSEEERQQAGVIPRAIRSIFHQLQQQEAAKNSNTIRDNSPPSVASAGANSTSFEYEVRIQFLEVYGEDIRDLLNPQQGSTASKLSIRDVGNEEPEVIGATEHKVESAEEALLYLTRGMYRRVTGSTAMNESSSRSHAILSVIVEQSSILKADLSTTGDESDHPSEGVKSSQQHIQTKKSKFNFVDLAGSERQKRTQASGQRLKEGIDINKGLLVLGNVISALGDPRKQGRTFVPYRDSKLTRLLKGSLGGNHKTLMIACVSPSSTNLEETVNCLRYANRAKNIQNHAVVNVDATSALVAELKIKVQRLADDLMKARTGKISECSIPLTVIESLVKDADDSDHDRWLTFTPRRAISPSPHTSNPQEDARISLDASFASMINATKPSYCSTKKLEAENEALRIQISALLKGSDSSDALQSAFVTKSVDYERQIALLKHKLSQSEMRHGRSHSNGSITYAVGQRRSESPELSRLKSQIFGSLSKFNTVDAEVEAEERSVRDLSEKYLSLDTDINEDENFQQQCADQKDKPSRELEDSALLIEADLVALSSSISAKEELILQLQSSQEKYESMREFYEEKLKEMEEMLSEKVTETEKLSEELKQHDVSNNKGKELSEKLKEKQEQVLELRRKQAELTRLTTVASRNESQISRLKDDVKMMKSRKVELQKTLTSERKSHKIEVQSLKKESMKKDQELTKAKRETSKMSQEATKAQNVAKVRLVEINSLKSKYKEAEKRLRIQTIKRGVLAKAGLNPVMIGRRESSGVHHIKGKSSEPNVNIDSIRDLFDQRVADVSRREHLAMKVAQEWEEHFDLTTQKELLEDGDGNDESIKALESQIKYREDRIRSIASKLGKRENLSNNDGTSNDDTLLFNKEFAELVGDIPLDVACRTAANVLFGMVVRERRRVASLARTASQLDEKVQEAEAAAAAKDAAFRAYVDEQTLEAANLAQNHQENILSLMEMVKENPTEDTTNEKLGGQGEGTSKLLVLANERIAALERQLNELSMGRDAVKKHREREATARALLEDKKKECEDLEEEMDELRSALRRIREEVKRGGVGELNSTNEDDKVEALKRVQDMVTNALHPSPASAGSNSRRRRPTTSLVLGQSPSLTPKIKRDAKSMHSSDSEEMPDWADDIMADLAIIAEGKIPASLLNTQVMLDAENQLNGNVFDRLTDPESFTGVQKHISAHPVRVFKGKSSSITDIPKRRELTSQQVAESLGKLKKKDSTGRNSRDRHTSKSDMEKRSVFDRLLSPSNLTGTQKQKFHDKKGRNLEKAIENQHVSTRSGKTKTSDCESNFSLSEGQMANDLLEDLLVRDMQGMESLGKRSGLNKGHQDVFERLNKTTTAAYAVKQNTNIVERMLDDLLHSSDSSEEEGPENPRCELKFERLEEYQKQDVFERLQRTTTEAYAQKKNASLYLDEHPHRAAGASPVAEKSNFPGASPASNRRVTRSQTKS